MDIEADVYVVVERKDHPTVERVGEEIILRPQGRDDLLLSFEPRDWKRWLKELSQN